MGSRRQATAGHELADELRELTRFALPIILTQVGQIVMMTTDLVLIGRISSEALAAAALAGRIYLLSFIFGAGLLGAVAPLAAQAFAAGNLLAIRGAVRMGLWMALLLSLPIIAFALCGEQLLLVFKQTPNAARLAQQYLFGIVWGIAPAFCFQVLRSFMSAVNRPGPILCITLAAIPVNAGLVYLLIYGKLGLPRLELFGAGVATTLVNCATFLGGLWFTTAYRFFRDYRVLEHLWRFDWTLMRQLLVLGIPISVSSLIGNGLFVAGALLTGLMSTRALAAHQIAVQIDVILLVISFGISMAAAIRVGHAVGRNDGSGVKRAGVAALLLGIVTIATLTIAVLAARFEIAELFLGDSGADADETIGLAAKLLLVGASFFISDAVESIAAGALRGLNDTVVPLFYGLIAYWVVGFPLTFLLGLKIGLGAVGIWIGLSIATNVFATLLVVRFILLANRLFFRADP
ncbi:MATE family efflux transporter [Bradyrhizobium sp. CCGE-LA001]|nr:MATE family efflux transporter [Bradyrhizobium sp. CCGE-LA001]AMA59995.1 MATE family efflux transporter [Bradyrhizobium sp. CCGE-LA001]